MKSRFYFEQEGTFGDRKVLIERLVPADDRGIRVVLFHGVHGCSSYVEGNKYKDLADLLLQRGLEVFLVETSRISRDRGFYGNDRESWARKSFNGKTYAQDLLDNCRALSFIVKNFPKSLIILWGFSLGGIHALNIMGGIWRSLLESNEPGSTDLDLPEIDRLVISGSGDQIRDEVSSSLSLPVLSTVSSPARLYEAASNIRAGKVLFFYGTLDMTFSEESSRRIFDLVGSEDKKFMLIDGADHSFREIKGLPSKEPLVQMVDILSGEGFFSATRARLGGNQENRG